MRHAMQSAFVDRTPAHEVDPIERWENEGGATAARATWRFDEPRRPQARTGESPARPMEADATSSQERREMPAVTAGR